MIHVNANTFTIKDDRIILNSYINKDNINFASCQCGELDKKDYLHKQHINVNCFIFPDILYKKIKNKNGKYIGYKLSIDMFNNGFIYSKIIKAHTTTCK